MLTKPISYTLHRTLGNTEPCSGICKIYPIVDQNCLIFIPYPCLNCLKTILYTVAHAHVTEMGSTHPWGGEG